MPRLAGCLLVLALAGSVVAQATKDDKPKEDKLTDRYGIQPDPRGYPQASPKETLASVLQAIERRRIGFLLAHLTDPQFVDERVKMYKGDFEQLVRETTTKLSDNPNTVAELE